jgi:hypothetical protein
MSKPLSILATIFLLVIPGLMTDRCSPDHHAPCGCAEAGAVEAGHPVEHVEPVDDDGSDAHRRWAFAIQGVVISFVDWIVIDRVAGVE